MGTSYVLNADFSLIISVLLILAFTTVVFILKSVNLKRLIRAIDLMAYVAEGKGLYNDEIVRIVNALPLSLIKSNEGNFTERYARLILKLDVFDLGSFLRDHTIFIENREKRAYLVNLIQMHIFDFSAEKLGRMLAEVIVNNAKDEESQYELTSGDEEIKDLLLKYADKVSVDLKSIASMNPEICKFFKACDEYCNSSKIHIDDVSKKILDAELIKIKVQYKHALT